jgi:hypothetical protein
MAGMIVYAVYVYLIYDCVYMYMYDIDVTGARAAWISCLGVDLRWERTMDMICLSTVLYLAG